MNQMHKRILSGKKISIPEKANAQYGHFLQMNTKHYIDDSYCPWEDNAGDLF